MNICYPICFPGSGGSEKYALYLAKEAKKAGHRVFFILGQEGPMLEEIKRVGIEYSFIPMESSFNPFLVISSALRLKKLYKEKKIDIVHTQMLREHSLAIAAKVFGSDIKLIRTFHRLDQFNLKMRPLISLYQKATDAFIAPTDFIENYLKTNGIKEKIYRINNGVPKVEAKTHQNKAGFLGRLVSEKGIVEYVKENKDIELIIGGDGPLRYELEKHPKVKLLGNITNLESFFSEISVMVLPSKTEVLPLSVLEAFSAGVPVVAFNLPSLQGIITEENGVMVPEGEYKKMGEAVRNLLLKQEMLEKLSAKAIQDYENNYTIDEMWEHTEGVYRRVLS